MNAPVDFGSYRPFSNFCGCCERRMSSDWIASRDRYECDACQRDWESEHAEDELQQAAE